MRHEHIGHLASLQSIPLGATPRKGLHYFILYTDLLLCHRTFRTVIPCIIFSRSQRELETATLLSFCRFCKNRLGKNRLRDICRSLKDTKWLIPYERREIPYDVTGTVDLKSNILKTREYFSAKFGRYLFLHFLNRMTSLSCQFINF